MTPFLNPWFLLAAILVVLGAFGVGYESNDGADRMKAQWDASDAAVIKARGIRVAKAREAQDKLQANADEARRKTDAENKKRDARLAAALSELRKRPDRPRQQPGVVPAPAGPGAQSGGCTGAGLYGPDAELLARKADLYQRIREQRDSCYGQYEDAQRALESLRH